MNKSLKSVVEKYWDDYEESFIGYERLCVKKYGHDGDRTKRLRHLNLRFRVALDVKIDFEGVYSRTQTKGVKEAYQNIMHLCDLWNVWEALKQVTNKGLNGVDCCLKNVENGIIEEDVLKKAIVFVETNKETLVPYVKRLYESSTGKQKGRLQNFFEKSSVISLESVLALIYAERNNYYHNGECSKYELSYSVRNKMLGLFNELLIQMIFKLSIHYFREQTHNN